MKRLRLNEWANIAEIVSAAAVVVSLLYVGVEIGQNTAAIKAQTHLALIDFASEPEELLLTDAPMLDIVTKGESDFDKLGGIERVKFVNFTTQRMNAWEAVVKSCESGLVDEEVCAAFDGFYKDLLQQPGYKQFFSETHSRWSKSFLEHVEGIMESVSH